MDFLSKLINRPKSVVLSVADQMDSSVTNGAEIKSIETEALSSSASKNVITGDRAKDTPKQIEDVQAEGIENQINEEFGCLTTTILNKGDEAVTEAKGHLNKPEIFGQKSISPLIVLPDSISVQSVVEETEGSHLLTSADKTFNLQTESKGNSALNVPNKAVDAISSDEEFYAECQSFNALQMPEDGFNRSVRWDAVLSNMTSSNIENLENIKHITEQAVADDSVYLDLHQTLESEHNNSVQNSASPNSDIKKESRHTKNVSANSPDSTLKNNTLEEVKPVGLNTISELKTACHEVTPLRCHQPSLDAKIPSSGPLISPNGENLNKTSEVKKCIVRQNSSPKVTSTIETDFEEEGREASGVPVTSDKIINIDETSSDYKLSSHVHLRNEPLEVEHTGDDVCSQKVPDFQSNIELDESNKSETNNDATRIMDQTMYVDHETQTLEESQNVFVEELMNRMDVTFNPASSMPLRKRRSNDFPSEKDFQGDGLIYNPSDFDFLLSKGCNSAPADDRDRDSLLLRFDPLVGRPSPVIQSQVYNPNLTIKEEEDLNSKNQGSIQSSEITDTQGKLHDSDIVHTEKLLQNVPVQNIKKEIESPPPSEPLVAQKLNTTRELKQSNDKMSVDVIQGLDIGNDSKSEENLRQKTENSQEYKVDAMEKKIKNEVLKTEDIEKKLKDAEQREEALLKRITEKDKIIGKMSGVIEAYEKAIAELIAEKELIIQSHEKQMSEIKSERDLNYKHLTSLESTFTDLHSKYERSKQLTTKLKASEDELKQEKKQNLEYLRLQEQRYDKMKSHAMQQLEMANSKLDSMQKIHTMEVTRLKALLKKEEIARLSVSEQLQQKTRENEELMKICDELISGQGATS